MGVPGGAGECAPAREPGDDGGADGDGSRRSTGRW